MHFSKEYFELQASINKDCLIFSAEGPKFGNLCAQKIIQECNESLYLLRQNLSKHIVPKFLWHSFVTFIYTNDLHGLNIQYIYQEHDFSNIANEAIVKWHKFAMKNGNKRIKRLYDMIYILPHRIIFIISFIVIKVLEPSMTLTPLNNTNNMHIIKKEKIAKIIEKMDKPIYWAPFKDKLNNKTTKEDALKDIYISIFTEFDDKKLLEKKKN